MYELSRTVRFCVTPSSKGGETRNGFAGWPAMAELGAYYELDVRVAGRPNPETGYLINIRTIDEVVRAHAIDLIGDAYRCKGIDPASIIGDIARAIDGALDVELTSVRWHLTPYHSITVTSDVDHIVIRQQFEFSAAHRLHVASMTDDENAACFGKCNNPSGHGHNYRLEVAVESPLTDEGGAVDIGTIECIVLGHVIDRFDHKNLNLDTKEFADVNPSVEHIARACHRLLAGPFDVAGGRLVEVTVWETEKTSCTYRAENIH